MKERKGEREIGELSEEALMVMVSALNRNQLRYLMRLQLKN